MHVQWGSLFRLKKRLSLTENIMKTSLVKISKKLLTAKTSLSLVLKLEKKFLKSCSYKILSKQLVIDYQQERQACNGYSLIICWSLRASTTFKGANAEGRYLLLVVLFYSIIYSNSPLFK